MSDAVGDETVIVRTANANDLPFLQEMLHEAAYWNAEGERPSLLAAMRNPEIQRYLEGFRRPGDFGLIAVTGDGDPVGAAWFRFFTSEAPGYGYVADDVPEVTIAVVPEWRGRGLGGRLLQELLACAHEAGLGRVSLSVSPANPARRLYERLGFVRTGYSGDSETMVVELSGTR